MRKRDKLIVSGATITLQWKEYCFQVVRKKSCNDDSCLARIFAYIMHVFLVNTENTPSNPNSVIWERVGVWLWLKPTLCLPLSL